MKETGINLTKLVKVLAREIPQTTIVGNARNEYGGYMVAFVATYPPDHPTKPGEFKTTGSGERFVLNWKAARE